MTQRLAAIDIGTNSIRCIVVEATPDGDFRVLDDEKATVRLGEGLAASGRIQPGAWERALTALERMKKILDGLAATSIEAVATSAVREAENGAAFLAAIKELTGVEVRLISGEEEAELAARSARRNFDLAGGSTLLVDIGGGSVETVFMVGDYVDEVHSLELGAVVLSERFLTSDPVSDDELERLRRHVRKMLRSSLPREPLAVQALVGSGGTMTSIGGMAMALRKEQFDSVHHYEVLHSEVVHLLAMLARKDQKARRAVAGLNPDRADIIVAGVLVVEELMRHFRTNFLRINEKGIREGLILQMLEKHALLPATAERRDWRQAVEDFARSCHFDTDHARQVNLLAQQLLTGVAPLWAASERDAQLLEAAALLHDVGYFISYSQHHKHSYHLVRHADLFGFSPREREIVANVARYHRKSLPKKKHEGFARLGAEDRRLVLRLGGILRLADGLDRRRNRLVTGLCCHLAGDTFQVRLEGSGDLSVELYGGETKGDLFAAAFGCRLELTTGADNSTPTAHAAPTES